MNITPPIALIFWAVVSVVLLLLFTHSYNFYGKDPHRCEMSYMYPSFTHLAEFNENHSTWAKKYSLHLYREADFHERVQDWSGVPLIFIPGNSGSFKQVRSLGSILTRWYHEELYPLSTEDRPFLHFDVFTVNLKEEFSGFYGKYLRHQTEYVNDAIRFILSKYKQVKRIDPRTQNELPAPTSVIIVGHSMGGFVGRLLFLANNYMPNSVNTLITLATTHVTPPTPLDQEMIELYETTNEYWRQQSCEESDFLEGRCGQDNSPRRALENVSLVSLAAGNRDTLVNSASCDVTSIVSSRQGITIYTSGIPKVWTAADHLSILWCNQLIKLISRTLYSVLNVSDSGQTLPVNERMVQFRKDFAGILPKKPNKVYDLGGCIHDYAIAHHLIVTTLNLESEYIEGEKMREDGKEGVIYQLIKDSSSSSNAFTFLQSTLEKKDNVDIEGCYEDTQQLHCQSLSHLGNLLPSTSANYRGKEKMAFNSFFIPFETYPEIDYIIVREKEMKYTEFVLAKISKINDCITESQLSQQDILFQPAKITIPLKNDILRIVRFPNLANYLMGYHLQIHYVDCKQEVETQPRFPSIVRQTTFNQENKYWVDMRETHVNFFPRYTPRAISSVSEESNLTSAGLVFEIWQDRRCEAIEISFSLDLYGALAKIGRPYVSLLIAFPFAIYLLVTLYQWNEWNTTGNFSSFSASLRRILWKDLTWAIAVLSIFCLLSSTKGVSLYSSNFLISKLFNGDPLMLISHPNPFYIPVILFVLSVGVIQILDVVLHILIMAASQLCRVVISMTCIKRLPTFSFGITNFVFLNSMISIFLCLFPPEICFLACIIINLFYCGSSYYKGTILFKNNALNTLNQQKMMLTLMIFILPFRVIHVVAWIRGLLEGEGGFPFDPENLKWCPLVTFCVAIISRFSSNLQSSCIIQNILLFILMCLKVLDWNYYSTILLFQLTAFYLYSSLPKMNSSSWSSQLLRPFVSIMAGYVMLYGTQHTYTVGQVGIVMLFIFLMLFMASKSPLSEDFKNKLG